MSGAEETLIEVEDAVCLGQGHVLPTEDRLLKLAKGDRVRLQRKDDGEFSWVTITAILKPRMIGATARDDYLFVYGKNKYFRGRHVFEIERGRPLAWTFA